MKYAIQEWNTRHIDLDSIEIDTEALRYKIWKFIDRRPTYDEGDYQYIDKQEYKNCIPNLIDDIVKNFNQIVRVKE